MKLSFKTILPILLIFTLLILFAGCAVIPDDQPGYTPGTITGIIAAPCCSTSAGAVSEPQGVSPEFWCYDCKNTWSLQNGVEVILTYGEDEVATTKTNVKGEYIFNNVDPGKNYVITALCPNYDDDRPLVKDVALELIASGSFDAKITDCVSTSLGLVVDFLVTYSELGPEDIVLDGVIAGKPNFWGFPRFKKLVLEVCRAEGECVNLNTDEDVQDALCKAAEEVGQIVLPDLDLGCTPGFTPGPGPTPGACDGNVKPDITLVEYSKGNGFIPVTPGETIHVIVNQSYTIRVTATDIDGKKDPLTYSGTVDGVPFGPNSSNQITVTPNEINLIGYSVSLSVYDGCDPTPWGAVTVVVGCPALESLALDITIPDPLCQNSCATINSATVSYSDATPDLLITDLTKLDWNYDDTKISFDSGTGAVCLVDGVTPGTYTINATYEDECEKTVSSGLVDITFEDCCPVAILDDLEFRVKLSSDGSDFENWTDMFGYSANPIFNSNTFDYDITTGESGSPKFGFRATGCDTLTLEYNWYRGESCTGEWLTGEVDASPNPLDDPPSWRPIVSAGIYPVLDKENNLCNKGGNILKIKVTTTSLLEEVYTIVINRVAVP